MGSSKFLSMFRFRKNENCRDSSSDNNSDDENILLNIDESRDVGGGGACESSRVGKNIYNDDDIIRVEDDKYVFNPYNSENVEITLPDIEKILAKYGVPSQVHNIELYKPLSKTATIKRLT